MKRCGKTVDRVAWIVVGLLVIPILAVIVGVGLLFWGFSDDHHEGSAHAVPTAQDLDEPMDIPDQATNISYRYDLHWQGGGTIVRYQLPKTDNPKIVAARHFEEPVTWSEITPAKPPVVERIRFDEPWFEPGSIKIGFQSNTSGIMWEPKVWIDQESNDIYLIHQN